MTFDDFAMKIWDTCPFDDDFDEIDNKYNLTDLEYIWNHNQEEIKNASIREKHLKKHLDAIVLQNQELKEEIDNLKTALNGYGYGDN